LAHRHREPPPRHWTINPLGVDHLAIVLLQGGLRGLSTPATTFDRCSPRPELRCLRAVQITRSGSPEILDLADAPEPTPGERQQLYDGSTAGINYADTHH
jgi:hypothetical protein